MSREHFSFRLRHDRHAGVSLSSPRDALDSALSRPVSAGDCSIHKTPLRSAYVGKTRSKERDGRNLEKREKMSGTGPSFQPF